MGYRLHDIREDTTTNNSGRFGHCQPHSEICKNGADRESEANRCSPRDLRLFADELYEITAADAAVSQSAPLNPRYVTDSAPFATYWALKETFAVDIKGKKLPE